MSARAPNIVHMTMRRSQFGSLADRLAASRTTPEAPAVRHVWLDSTLPGLVIDRRRNAAGDWEGLVVTVIAGQVHQEWVPGTRITKTATT